MTDAVKTDGQAAEERPLGLTPEKREQLSDAWDQQVTDAVDDPEPEEETPTGDEPEEVEDQTTQPDEQDASDEEPEEQEPPKKDDLDHGERSRLGRRVKRLQDQIEERDKKLDEAMSKIDRLSGHIEAITSGGTGQVEEGPRSVDEIDDDAVITGADLKRIRELEQKEASTRADRERQAQEQYQEGYYKALLNYEDDEDFDALFDALTSPDSKFNVKLSDNPALDVRTNIAEARYALSTTSEGKKKNPNLQGKKAEGTGVGGEDKVKEKEAKGVDISKLSPEAQSLLTHVRSKGRDPQAIANRSLGAKK